MTADPTAAERARRYRANRRKRDASVTSRTPELVAVIGRLVDEVRELSTLIRGDIHNVDNRDVTARHAVQRDVTERHGPEGARARTREKTPSRTPTGSVREGGPILRDVTADRILVVLGHAHAAQSAAAIADALEAPIVAVTAELQRLAGAGSVTRFPAVSERDAIRWQLPAVESPAETIDCRAYREHAVRGHRRDPVTQRFRCYICNPDTIEPIEAAGLFT